MISFVIPTLNEQQTVEQTLECLAGYSGEHEIIVSDDNSTDATVEICRRYAHTVVRYTQPEKQTIAQVRNRGAAAARGDFLVFVDADVVIPDIDEFFRSSHTRFQSDSRLVALTGQYRVTPESATAADRFVFTMLGLQFLLQNNVLRVGAASGKFQMVAADAFQMIGGFNEKLVASEDMDLFRRLSRVGRTHFARDLTVYHSGRRAKAIGWRKLLWQWFSNSVAVFFFSRSVSREWKVIR
ncbi:glycosyltransferase [Mycobacterium sp. CVI_P3]|uniref:4,4'-diaponeurosporenoate glycosyltransferase n=1 Tax=Mycobacterium pinniadriaticum TaxID=2994102 RepID=A0ABT3SIL3_9MYCO|nr:glycosyltransferase [Mycobacterium pinniadriaticum]MCX2932573.1 glycosyltransferase [Mycobacterium pinniadriaticum]MCX2938983.1 glycosyltransferase [Mycobacterium pinniadriaticum]